MPPEGSHDGASFFVCFLGGHTFSFSCDDSGVTFPPVSPVSCPTFRFHFCVPLISCYLLSRISPISLFCLQPQSAGIACATQPVDKVGWQQSDVLSRTAHKVENHRMLRPHARDPPPRPSHTVPCPSTEGRSSTPARSRSFCAHRTPSPVRWSPNGAHLTTLATDWSLPCPLAPCGSPPFFHPVLIPVSSRRAARTAAGHLAPDCRPRHPALFHRFHRQRSHLSPIHACMFSV